MTVKLPNEINGQLIRNREVGFTGFTVTWAMAIDEHGYCWLRSNFPAYYFQGGTVCMKIELREDGWHVWSPPGAIWKVPEYDLADLRHRAFRNDWQRHEYVPVIEIHLYQE